MNRKTLLVKFENMKTWIQKRKVDALLSWTPVVVDRRIFKTCNIVQKNCPDIFHFSVWHSGEPTTHQSYCQWIHLQGCAESPSLNQNSVIKCKTKKLTAIWDNHKTAQLWLKLTYLIHKANSHHLGRLSSSFCIQDNWLNPWGKGKKFDPHLPQSWTL